MCPNPGEFGEEFYDSSSRVALLIRLEYVKGLHSSNLAKVILMSFSGSFNVASGGLSLIGRMLTS